ncbi:hypothetical protein AWZ03_005661 [Drosophila navojoa]|uniref:Uncharacterized protein n=1 Tax=Drosophila navojoa TaxID=7232 RepID=A0A484BIK4_DRONA|nr:uncharacterized protein LOC108653356 [Drosophila navojoa]TDG47880.1 hypothetical protein AWZ03_005661 [Drosophila navojoa]
MPSQAPNTALNFKIKLLSGNNVVLVDCVGFESELFMPQIIKGRITFQNIIPNHRCCNAAAANVQTGQLILPASKLGDVKIVTGLAAGTAKRLNYRPQIANMTIPLPGSTSSSSSSSERPISRADKENLSMQRTPEQVRCRVPAGTGQGGVLPTSSPICLDAFETSSSSTLPSPALDSYTNRTVTQDSLSINPPSSTSSFNSSAKSPDFAQCNFMHKAPPMRTYSRRKPNTMDINNSSGGCSNSASVSHPKSPLAWRKKKLTKVSSTKPPSPCMKLELRRRKLIVDQKKSLPKHTQTKATSTPITTTKIRRKQVSGKTRQQFDALKGTAFDMLTSMGHSHVSAQLAKQFKEACVEKYSEALPSYAELSGTRPLEHDRQVRSLIAKAKRLDKQMSKSEKVQLKRKRM